MAFCEKHGITVTGEFVDVGVSGTTSLGSGTPGLIHALEEVARTKSAFLIVHRSDRLSRSLPKLYEVKAALARTKASLAIADDDALPVADDEFAMMREVFVGLQSQMTVLLLRKRTREALQSKKSKGERYSNQAPFGFKWDGGKMVEDATEQGAIQTIVNLSEQGFSTPKIAKELANNGIFSRTGKTLTPTAVWRVIKAHGVAA